MPRPLTYMAIARRALRIPASKSDLKWLSIRNRHAGQPCYIIANGPSLDPEYLTQLHRKKQLTIASNKIFLIFNKTTWRPTYYTAADITLLKNSPAEMANYKDSPIFLSRGLKNNMPSLFFDNWSTEPLFFNTIGPRSRDPYVPRFSTNPLRGFFVGQTITNVNLQLAVYLGCSPIYILGLDGYPDLNKEKILYSDNAPMLKNVKARTHFSEDYHSEGEIWCKPPSDLQALEYQNAMREYTRRNIPIFNLSANSSIDAFPRKSLYSII